MHDRLHKVYYFFSIVPCIRKLAMKISKFHRVRIVRRMYTQIDFTHKKAIVEKKLTASL